MSGSIFGSPFVFNGTQFEADFAKQTPGTAFSATISLTNGGGSYPGITATWTNNVPEPSTWAMMGLGFAGLAFAGYRSRRSAAAVA